MENERNGNGNTPKEGGGVLYYCVSSKNYILLRVKHAGEAISEDRIGCNECLEGENKCNNRELFSRPYLDRITFRR